MENVRDFRLLAENSVSDELRLSNCSTQLSGFLEAISHRVTLIALFLCSNYVQYEQFPTFYVLLIRKYARNYGWMHDAHSKYA